MLKNAKQDFRHRFGVHEMDEIEHSGHSYADLSFLYQFCMKNTQIEIRLGVLLLSINQMHQNESNEGDRQIFTFLNTDFEPSDARFLVVFCSN